MLVSLALSLLPLVRAPEPAVQVDPVRQLRTWAARARRSRDGLDRDQYERVRDVLFEVRVVRDEAPERRSEIDLAMLDLAALAWSAGSPSPEGLASRRALSALGLEELERRFRFGAEGFGPWLANTILARPRVHKIDRRIAAAKLLEGRYLKSTLPVLMSTGRIETGDLRDAILGALVGWPDPIVHHFFLESLEPNGAGDHPPRRAPPPGLRLARGRGARRPPRPVRAPVRRRGLAVGGAGPAPDTLPRRSREPCRS